MFVFTSYRVKILVVIPQNLIVLVFQRGAFVSEPAILVKRKGLGSQVWSMEKLENKLIDMRDVYEEKKEKNLPLKVRTVVEKCHK
jgi:kinesin family protein 13